MFCWLRSKFVFYQILWVFWGHLGVHLAQFFRKKPFRKSLQKKGASIWKRVTMGRSRGSQRSRLLLFFIKAAASRARCLDNNNNNVKLNSIQFKSSWGLAEVWLRSGRGLAEVWLRSGWSLAEVWLSWLRFGKYGKGCCSKITRDLITPTGPMPGEFFSTSLQPVDFWFILIPDELICPRRLVLTWE